jgi:hypothetical protein
MSYFNLIRAKGGFEYWPKEKRFPENNKRKGNYSDFLLILCCFTFAHINMIYKKQKLNLN